MKTVQLYGQIKECMKLNKFQKALSLYELNELKITMFAATKNTVPSVFFNLDKYCTRRYHRSIAAKYVMSTYELRRYYTMCPI